MRTRPSLFVSLLVPLLVALAWTLVPGEVAAQFETPSRAFHNTYAFRLEGRHQSVPCTACHINGQFAGTPTTCVQCHWIRRKDDRFQTRLGSECQNCHRPTSWTATSFNHAPMAGQPLGASHRRLACESCHKGGQFTTGAADCQSCHRKDYEATRAPNHAAAGFPTTCDSCHRPGDPVWQSPGGGGGFNHSAIFQLVGTHATQACGACHRNNVYRGTPRDCVGCHLANYNNSRNPNHVAAGLPTTCDSCHRASDASWGGGSGFNHGAVFALVGVHATQPCVACHRNNVYRGTARDCVGCHLAQYTATTAPNHAAAGFPTTCDACHRATDTRWTGVTFNHSAFALQGVHATQTCAACHRNNVYRGTARDCVGCHLSRYNSTTNPNHPAAGFPTTCESCHRGTDTSWTQGRFAHTQFPISSGRHAVPCAQCHTTANNFRLFSCTVCHTRAETDGHHRNRAGYVYESNACYSCHPNGRG